MVPGLVGGLAGSFLKNYIGKNFGGVPSRDASNAGELEEARLKGGAMSIIPGMNANQGFTEPYGDPRENLKNALGGIVGGLAGDAMKQGRLPGPIGGLASTFF